MCPNVKGWQNGFLVGEVPQVLMLTLGIGPGLEAPSYSQLPSPWAILSSLGVPGRPY